ncbi:thiamine pyrophosphate-dependent enzyme [Frankia nepalensis]|uniref:thiamine pyrophosphate-dependent enzyme n=1 Tax=Frankia nepalensis TaxID=1836974 RepID=UPI0027DE9128|nr:thiamine pyrophosphate-dependent enzyme [Frankia nepalensis]
MASDELSDPPPAEHGVRLLNPDGTPRAHPEFDALLDVEDLKSCYGAMLRARHLDDAATTLQRQGELALWIPLRGQEAAQVGSVRAAAPADFLFPSYREHAVAWERGLPPVEVMRLLRGITHGGWDPAAYNLANYALVLATQTLHAVGYALGIQLDAERARSAGPGMAAVATVAAATEGRANIGRPTIGSDPENARGAPARGHPENIVGPPIVGRPTNTVGLPNVGRPTNLGDVLDAAVVVYLGDGAMSQGDANEAFVWAASFNAPVVFFCTNNQWAISTPAARQARVPLAERAAGFGFPGVRVDGNDVVAVHAVTTWALERARAGAGPTLIEAYTYRMGPHTTSDDPTRYQPAEALDRWRALDPIDRVARALAPVCDPGWFDERLAEARATATRLRAQTLALADPPPDAFFDEVLVTETDEGRAQRAAFREYRESFQV